MRRVDMRRVGVRRVGVRRVARVHYALSNDFRVRILGRIG